MKTHIVQAGECLATIALQYGFRNWKTIYDAPENSAFRQKRPNPNVIYPGDSVVIPEKQHRVEDRSTDKRHKFKVKSERWLFRIEMKDEEGNGIEGESYELAIEGSLPSRGKTGPNGLIQVEVLQHARQARLKFMGEVFEVHLGMLDPISRVKGVQARLNNLGFNAGAVDGIVGPRTRRAVYIFQRTQPDLKPTGDIDDATRRCLLEIHDNDNRVTAVEENMAPSEAPPLPADAPPLGEDPPEDASDRDGSARDWSRSPFSYEDF